MGKISVLSLVSILIFLIFLINLFQTSYAANPYRSQCDINVLDDNNVLEIDVSPVSDCKGIMIIIAKCEFNNFYNCSELHFNISVKSEMDWHVELYPFEFILTPKLESQLIFVNITVPRDCSFYATDYITITGTATSDNGSFIDINERFAANLRIKQFYSLEINKVSISTKIRCGNEKTFNFSIKNTGNGRDIFKIDVTNKMELENSGIKISYPSEIEIQNGDNKTVEISVKAKSDAQIGNYNIEFNIKSIQENKDTEYSENKTLLVNIEIIEGNNLLKIFLDFTSIILIGSLIIIMLYFIKKSKKRD